MKAGAIEFLTKPFRDQDLLDAINVGLARDRVRRDNDEALSALRARFEVLTPRERAILIRVVEGRLNKQIAGEMGITETTVKVHRCNLMRKIKAASVPELCRMVDKLKLLPGTRAHLSSRERKATAAAALGKQPYAISKLGRSRNRELALSS